MDVRECGPTHHACACQLRTLDRLATEVAHLRAALKLISEYQVPGVSTPRLEVEADSTDLTEAWRELLSRLPSDVYAALKDAMADEVIWRRTFEAVPGQQIPPGGAPVEWQE